MSWTLLLKTLRDRWRSSLAWAVGITALSSVQLYIYPSIQDSASAMDQFLKAFPKEFIAMFRIEDYTSGAGFLGTELFSMMIPIVFISVGASWGAAIAAEEEHGTSEVLYALPLSRTRIIVSKTLAAWLVQLWLVAVVLLVISFGASLVDLDLSEAHLIPVTLSCLGLGLFFNAFAFCVGAFTGKRGAGLGLAIALALISFLVFSLAPMVDTFDAIVKFMPFQWALGENPLLKGFDWVGLGWLGLGAGICYLLGLVAVNRRDLDAR